MTTVRRIEKAFTAHTQKEGAGFIVQRPFPGRALSDEQTDPFLMLDEIGPLDVDANSPGAPWHPHRGFDTVTYIKSGCGAHQDSLGNKGFISTGEVQWMHTGSGIIHDEGPPKGMTQAELERYGKKMHGFQIWINNPPAMKMTPPTYTHLTAESFSWQPWGQNAQVKVFAGAMKSALGTVQNAAMALPAPVLLVDAVIKASGSNSVTDFPIDPIMETCIVYVYGGEGRAYDGNGDSTGTVIKRQDTVFFAAPVTAAQHSIRLRATDREGLSVLIMAGKKIGAPIARHGPFVMNTQAEIGKAFEDYQSGKLATIKASAKAI